MKKLVLIVAALAVSVAHADRTDVWSASSVAVYKVELNKMTDGGCSVRACATLSKQDGGTKSKCTQEAVEVGGANRTTCLDIIDVKAPNLFKSEEGL